MSHMVSGVGGRVLCQGKYEQGLGVGWTGLKYEYRRFAHGRSVALVPRGSVAGFNGLRPAADLFPFLVRACAYAFVCEVLDVAREKIL